MPLDTWHFENFARAWTEGNFGRYFLNTVFVTVCVVAGKVLLSSMVGYVLARTDMPGKRFCSARWSG